MGSWEGLEDAGQVEELASLRSQVSKTLASGSIVLQAYGLTEWKPA